MLVPIFPLPNVVLFPDTLLPLHVFEPRYRRMVADLLAQPAAERRVGMILGVRSAAGSLALCEPGCLGRLVAHEPLEDGRSNIVLAGERRFDIEREVTGREYRQAIVEPLVDEIPLVASDRADATHAELLALAASVVSASGGASPLDLASLAGLGSPQRLAVLANRIAAQLDLPVERKQTLLAEAPLARAEEVAGILRSRVKLLRALAPFRRLADSRDHN